MKKKLLSFSIIMIAFLLFVVPVYAAGSSGSHSGSFSAYYGIVGNKSMTLSGKKKVSGTVRIDRYDGYNDRGKVKVSIITKRTFGGHKTICTKTVCSLAQKKGDFSWTKKFEKDNYYIYVFKPKEDRKYRMHGKLSYKWS